MKIIIILIITAIMVDSVAFQYLVARQFTDC